MRTLQGKDSAFQKVGECLYRYSSNGVYYARIEASGKEIRRSLGTTDRDLAKRNLAKFKDEQQQVDHSKGNDRDSTGLRAHRDSHDSTA